VVQASPSLHDVPFDRSVMLVQAPVPESQAAVWQSVSEPEQSTGAAPTHAPVWQLSMVVQASPSLHDVPFDRSVMLVQAPVPELQLAVWQAVSEPEQSMALPPQVPAVQTSETVQASPSSQEPASLAFCIEHTPVEGAQVLARQAVSPLASQVTTVVASTTQVLPVQMSVPLQRLPSSIPAQSAVVMHSQVLLPAAQAPVWQVSKVQGMASRSQTVPSSLSAKIEQRPEVPSQLAVWQSVLELVQSTAAPAVQVPA